MGFDEKIGDHIPGLVREFLTLCHHRIPFRKWRALYKISAPEARRLGFSGFRTESSPVSMLFKLGDSAESNERCPSLRVILARRSRTQVGQTWVAR